MRYPIGLLIWGLALVWTAPIAIADTVGVIVMKETGDGSRSLRAFTIKDRWETRWESAEGIALYLYDEKGDAVSKLASSKRAGSGTTFYPTGGTYFLKVASNGDWTVTVVQLP